MDEMDELTSFAQALEQMELDVEMTPSNSAGVDAAVREMERKVDSLARQYLRSKAVQFLAADIKKTNAAEIREAAQRDEE